MSSFTVDSKISRESVSMSKSPKPRDSEHCCKSKVRSSRVIFVICLIIVAALLGYVSYEVLTESEEKLAEGQYDATAERALNEALDSTLRKRLGVKALATMMSYTFPDAKTWPNVSIKGFEDVAESIMDVATGATMGLCPFVTSDQLAGFEDFAYDIAFPVINGYPNTTGLRDFDDDGTLERGVHGFHEGELYRETDGKSFWGSQYDIMCPFIMHSSGPRVLMANLHSVERFGTVIDEVIECADSTTKTEGTDEGDLDLSQCAVLSDMIIMYDRHGEETGPAAIIVQPIYPANNNNVLSGIIHSTMQWNDVLATLFSTEISGVDCVLETETLAYTYYIDNGVATLKGEGSLHDPRYSRYRRSIDLYSPGLFTYTSASYTLTLYPTDEFFGVYRTKNPIVATIGSVCIVVFTASLFFLYDLFVRQEFHHKQAITEAKRRYVRFISHEVRTPLSIVSQGCQLLQQEMSKACRSRSKRGRLKDEPASSTTESMREPIEEWADLVREVLDNADSAVNVLSDLLNYDQVESGTLRLELSVIPIWSLIKGTASEFRLAAKAKYIKYGVDFKPLIEDSKQEAAEDDVEKGEKRNGTVMELPRDVQEQMVVGDKMRITHVLRNFLSNAVKLTPEEGDINVCIAWKRPTARLGSETRKKFVLESGDEVSFLPSGYVEVSVKDSGKGMSEEQVESIFDESLQSNENKLRADRGTGLGLYIAKGIVEQHGGYLTVASRGIGRGTTFTTVLPLYHVPESALPENLRNRRQANSGDFGEVDGDEEIIISPVDPLVGVLRILVVDESRTSRKLLVRLLVNKGHVCDEAESGSVALDMVEIAMEEENPYDCILLDYELPKMRGPKALAKMRELGCSSFIVGVTGNILPEDVQYFKRKGANCVFPKPLKLRDLEAAWVENGVSGSQRDESENSYNCIDRGKKSIL